MSGAMAAIASGFDIIGTSFIGLTVAVGGGTIRDVIIGRTPVFWMKDTNFLAIALAVALATYAFSDKIEYLPASLTKWVDNFGIASFCIVGT
jgi:uncharacterized membrane protein YeiH